MNSYDRYFLMPVVNVKLNESIDSPHGPVLHCMCIKHLMSLSFVGEAKEIEFVESQNLCSVNEQEEPGPHKCLEDNFQLKSN